MWVMEKKGLSLLILLEKGVDLKNLDSVFLMALPKPRSCCMVTLLRKQCGPFPPTHTHTQDYCFVLHPK